MHAGVRKRSGSELLRTDSDSAGLDWTAEKFVIMQGVCASLSLLIDEEARRDESIIVVSL